MAKTVKRVLAALYLLVVVLALAGSCNSRPPRSNQHSGSLHQAAVMGDAALTAKLIKEGADVNEVDSHGRATPLGVAADGGHVEIAKLLMDNGADVNKECPLYYAAQHGRLEVAKMLLLAGANPNKYRMEGTPTPILAAARDGHLAVVRLLAVSGSELGPSDGDFSPLIQAATGGHADVVEFLASKGVGVTGADSDGRTAFYMAAFGGHVDVMRALAKRGADWRRKTREGLSPLGVADQRRHAEAVKFIEELERGKKP